MNERSGREGYIYLLGRTFQMVVQGVPELMVPFIDEAGNGRWGELRQL
jgi:hypothetical protein